MYLLISPPTFRRLSIASLKQWRLILCTVTLIPTRRHYEYKKMTYVTYRACMNMLVIFTGEENFKISNLLVEHVAAVIKVDTNCFCG